MVSGVLPIVTSETVISFGNQRGMGFREGTILYVVDVSNSVGKVFALSFGIEVPLRGTVVNSKAFGRANLLRI